jgi:hypothetical protein
MASQLNRITCSNPNGPIAAQSPLPDARFSAVSLPITAGRRRNGVRRKTHFASRFKQITLSNPPAQNILFFFFPETMISSSRPVSIRGALRGRHGR